MKYTILILALMSIFMTTNCGEKPVVKQVQTGYYYCPMHPEITDTKPGLCKICNMKLEFKADSKTEEQNLEKEHANEHEGEAK